MLVVQTATLIKRDSNIGVFLWILRTFYEHLFWRTSAYGSSWSDLRKWLFRTFSMNSRFQNHPDLVILQKYKSLSNQSIKHNLAHIIPYNQHLRFLFNPGFVCWSLMITTGKVNACSDWTYCSLWSYMKFRVFATSLVSTLTCVKLSWWNLEQILLGLLLGQSTFSYEMIMERHIQLKWFSKHLDMYSTVLN